MNKIKEFFTDWSWKEKAWLAFVLIVSALPVGGKAAELGTWSKR